MSSSHRIITSGTALVLCPKIKQHFGVSAALVLQQLHYWLSKENRSYGIIDESGYQWIRNTYEQWREQIQVLTLSTLRRAFSTLEEKNIILSQRFPEKSRYAGGNQVKFYTINYNQLESIIGNLGHVSINIPSRFAEQNNGAEDTSLETSIHNFKKQTKTANQPRVQNSIENCSKQPDHLLRMNTLPAQNEQALYITKNTSKKTSLLGTSQQIKNTQRQELEVETIQPDKPAERYKFNMVEEMIFLWNEIIEQTPNKIALTTKRSQHLNAAFKQYFNSDLADWEAFCCKIASSKFLMGDVKAFKANLDWSIRFETIQRILEGGYSFGDRVVNYTPRLNSSHVKEECISVTAPLHDNTHIQSEIKQESSKALLIRQRIHQIVGNAIYLSWFKNTEIVCEQDGFNEKKVTLYVSSRFIAERLRTHYSSIIETYFDDIRVGKPHELDVMTNRSLMPIATATPSVASTSSEPSLAINRICMPEIIDQGYKDKASKTINVVEISEEYKKEPILIQPFNQIIKESYTLRCFKNAVTNRQKSRGDSPFIQKSVKETRSEGQCGKVDDRHRVHEYREKINTVTPQKTRYSLPLMCLDLHVDMPNRYIKIRRKTVVKDNILFFVSAIPAEKSLKSLETPGLSAESSRKLTFENGSNIRLPVLAEMTVFVLEKDKTDLCIVNHQKETDVVLLHVPIHRTKYCMQSQLKDVIDDSFREIRVIEESLSENKHRIRHTTLLQSSRSESISSKRIQTHEVRGDTLRGANSINENTHPSLLKKKQFYMHNHLASKREGVCFLQ